MTKRTSTIAPDYFDALYRSQPDPWGFQSSEYERGKYRHTLEALSRPRYRRALEVGCSIGVFTTLLAPRCETLLAIDASSVALETARKAAASCANVTFETRMVPGEFPTGPFDLIVLSEVLYYLDIADLRRLAVLCADALSAEGEIVACHWLGETDYPLAGDEASDLFAEAMLKRLPTHEILNDRTYRLDRLRRG